MQNDITVTYELREHPFGQAVPLWVPGSDNPEHYPPWLHIFGRLPEGCKKFLIVVKPDPTPFPIPDGAYKMERGKENRGFFIYKKPKAIQGLFTVAFNKLLNDAPGPWTVERVIPPPLPNPWAQ